MIWSVICVHDGVDHLKFMSKQSQEMQPSTSKEVVLLYVNIWYEAFIFTFYLTNYTLYRIFTETYNMCVFK